MLLALLAAAAGSGDTATEVCPGYTVEVDGTWEDGVCVRAFWSTVTWSEMTTRHGGDSEWELDDCGEGSDVGHRATHAETEWVEGYDFDEGGVLIGEYEVLFEGTPWCCEGRVAWRVAAGVVGGTCVPMGDTGDLGDTGDTGATDGEDDEAGGVCGEGCGKAGGAVAGVLVLLAGWSRRRAAEQEHR